MALAELIARLEEDAAREAASISAEADAEVEAVRAATDVEIRERMARRAGETAAARHRERDRELAEARRDARRRELEAARALVARVLDRARALAGEAATSEAYRAALPVHLEDALSYVEGEARVMCPPALAPLVSPILAGRPHSTSIVDERAAAGVVVEAVDGSVVIDNTLAARLDRVAPDLAIDLVREATRGRG